MIYYAVKTLLSALIIVAIAEIAKRNTIAGALLASLPLTSLLAFIWLYWETHDTARIASLSIDIFWLSLLAAIALTAACYAGLFWVLRRLDMVH
jgi:hypothetical protein